jgi:hypothetical protein
LAATGTYTGPMTFAAPYQGGDYAVTLTASGDEYTILSEGRAGTDTSRVQKAYRFERGGGGPAPRPVPAFMGAGITIGNDLSIKHDFTVNAGPGGENANVHANNNVNPTAGRVHIEGFVTYGTNINYNNGETPEGTIFPPSNPSGDPVYSRVPEITIPGFNAADYASLATVTTPGDLALSGNVTLGTKDNPVIWYINGNVTTTGDATISGYGVIIAKGNVTIRHNVWNTTGADESSFALYTGNNLKVDAGSLTLTGQFLVGNDLQTKANTTLVGSVTVGNNLQTQGPFTNNYRPASAALTDPFWPPGPAPAPAPAPVPSGGDRLVVVVTRVW